MRYQKFRKGFVIEKIHGNYSRVSIPAYKKFPETMWVLDPHLRALWSSGLELQRTVFKDKFRTRGIFKRMLMNQPRNVVKLVNRRARVKHPRKRTRVQDNQRIMSLTSYIELLTHTNWGDDVWLLQWPADEPSLRTYLYLLELTKRDMLNIAPILKLLIPVGGSSKNSKRPPKKRRMSKEVPIINFALYVQLSSARNGPCVHPVAARIVETRTHGSCNLERTC